MPAPAVPTESTETLDEFLAAERARLAAPIRVTLPPENHPSWAHSPVRTILEADTPEALLLVLGLVDLPPRLMQAGLLAFAARCPGQAKKMSAPWIEALDALGAFPPAEVWATAIAVGEHIASHRYVKTPMAPR